MGFQHTHCLGRRSRRLDECISANLADLFSGGRLLVGRHRSSKQMAANTWDRVKTRTTATFTSGVYTWRVYIPPLTETGASSSIRAFL